MDALPEGAYILDVREHDEFNAGHIPGAVHVPMDSVPQRTHVSADTVLGDGTTYVVCKLGGRSAQVTAWLVQQGYDAVNLAGGTQGWADAGRPLVSENGALATVL